MVMNGFIKLFRAGGRTAPFFNLRDLLFTVKHAAEHSGVRSTGILFKPIGSRSKSHGNGHPVRYRFPLSNQSPEA